MSKAKNSSPTDSNVNRESSRTGWGGNLAIVATIVGAIGYMGIIVHQDSEETAYNNLIVSKYETASRTAHLTDGIELGKMAEVRYPHSYLATYTDSKLRAKTTISFGRCAVEGEIIAIDNPSGTGLPEVSYALPLLQPEAQSVTIEVADIDAIKSVDAYKNCFVS